MNKKCKKCGEVKLLFNFSKNKNGKYGLRSVCKKCDEIYRIKYYKKNSIILKEKNKEYRENNKEKLSDKSKLYSKNNKEKIRLKALQKRRENLLYNLSINIRSLIRGGFISKNYKKTSKTLDILGCSFEEFKLYLESKFEPWMNWENKGKYNATLNYGWDIDHIIPLISAKTKEEMIKLNHYSNLQPLCSYTNRNIKKGKY